jgi:hypothetical protein
MKTVTQKVIEQLLDGDSASGLIDVITVINLKDLLEIVEQNQLNAPYDTGIDAEENQLDISALRRVIAMYTV